MSGIQRNKGSIEITSKNWIEYIREKENVCRSFLANLRPLYPHLDSEYISALADIEQYNFADPITALVTVQTSLNRQDNASITFSNDLEKFFIDMYTRSQTLRKIVEKRRAIYGYIAND